MKVRIQPNARKNEVVGVHDGSLKIKINAAPEDGKANKELCAFVAACLGIARSRVSVIRGHASRDKVLSVADMSDQEILAKLLAHGR